MEKKYVIVTVEVDADGIIRPLKILWADGRRWEVTKVLHTCTLPTVSLKEFATPLKLGRTVRYLYRDGQRWYVGLSP